MYLGVLQLLLLDHSHLWHRLLWALLLRFVLADLSVGLLDGDGLFFTALRAVILVDQVTELAKVANIAIKVKF